MQDKELVIEIFRRIHALGGYDASEQFDRGWDAWEGLEEAMEGPSSSPRL